MLLIHQGEQVPWWGVTAGPGGCRKEGHFSRSLSGCFFCLEPGGHFHVPPAFGGEGAFRASLLHLLFSDCPEFGVISVVKQPIKVEVLHLMSWFKSSPFPSMPSLTFLLALPTMEIGVLVPSLPCSGQRGSRCSVSTSGCREVSGAGLAAVTSLSSVPSPRACGFPGRRMEASPGLVAAGSWPEVDARGREVPALLT